MSDNRRAAVTTAASVRRLAIIAVLASIGGCTLRRVERSASRVERIPVAGAHVLRLDVGAGYLRVQGNAGDSEIVVSGTARAASEQLLAAVQLQVRRSGDTIYVAGLLPAARGSSGLQTALDVNVDLPNSLALYVTDSTGESVFRDVGALRVVHGDGGLNIEGVTGDLDLTDGRGDLVVGNVKGNVRIENADGAIYITSIDGSVAIPKDGSGEVQISGVTGDVAVESKRSGEVAASQVGGNFMVRASGTGSIEYRDVKGRVMLPGGTASLK